jgi:predicted aconitase
LHLTREEERIYDGEEGWAYQTAIKILVKLGDLFGATRLIPIESAHISGVSYKTIGDAPIEFLKALAEAGAKSRVASTVNPGGLDYRHLADMAASPRIRDKQREIIGIYEKMGVNPVLTCTPYYIKKPKQAANLAWAESSAVIYANSILGSWTNREGGPSALAAALIGKTPNYGMHRPENREANIMVKVDAELENEAAFGALGAHLGGALKDRIPVIEGLPGLEEANLKQLGAAMASTGMTPMFHPCRSCPKESRRLETVNVGREDLREAIESLSTTHERPDMVFLGCPHCSFQEVNQIAEQIKGRKVKKDIKFWVCTSRYIRQKAENPVNIIEEAGGKVVCDTCAVVTWIKDLGVATLMTNSAKTAHYAPTMNKVKVRFAPLAQCVKGACA